jgi:hypothetical protein
MWTPTRLVAGLNLQQGFNPAEPTDNGPRIEAVIVADRERHAKLSVAAAGRCLLSLADMPGAQAANLGVG